MKSIKMFKWNWLNTYRSMIILYAITLAIYILFTVLIHTLNSTGSMSVRSGSVIWMFVIGVAMHHQGYRVGLSVGVSRRSIYLGNLLFIASLAAATAVIDTLLILLFGTMFDAFSVTAGEFVSMIATGSEPLHTQMDAAAVLGRFAGNIVSGITVTSLGFFVGAAYYRMGKLTKILVSAGVPLLFVLGASLVGARMLPAFVYTAAGNAINWFIASQVNEWILSLGFTALLLAALYLLTRRAPIKPASM